MTKVKPTTKEQLVYYLIQNISLGTYDRRFLTNLQSVQARDKKPATSNQSDLLDKITLRYSKQLRRQEIDAEDMVKLPWNIQPIDSIPEYTDAFCEIKDGIIEIRSPYKKEFITDIKDTKIPVNWNREERLWTVPLSEYSLKHVIDCLDKHYHIIRYCKKVTDVISRFADFEAASCWNPTYKKVNGNYVIACINPILYDVLADVSMDVDPSTLARISAAGVDIDPDVLTDAAEEMWGTDEAVRLIEFATNPNAIINTSEISMLVRHLKEIKCDFVLIQEAFKTSNSNSVQELYRLLSDSVIETQLLKRNDSIEVDMRKYKFPVVINTALWGFNQTSSTIGGCKTVFLGNNKPIEIK